MGRITNNKFLLAIAFLLLLVCIDGIINGIPAVPVLAIMVLLLLLIYENRHSKMEKRIADLEKEKAPPGE